MTDTYAAQILADSISPDNNRLTTFWVTFPRFILAEVNTHRAFSRNSNSSRAIPPELQIARVRENPFVPETFNKRVKGMGVGIALTGGDAEAARRTWTAAADYAADAAEHLMGLDCDKSRINRLLEPFLWHSAAISTTDWDNFFALRYHPAAQPEFKIIAGLMKQCMVKSFPVLLDRGMWHLPAVDPQEMANQAFGGKPIDWEQWKRVSAGRLARYTSYNLTTEDPVEAAIERAERLTSSFHMSPTEHQARPFSQDEMDMAYYMRETLEAFKDSSRKRGQGLVVPEWMDRQTYYSGNFKGWVQYRKTIPNEHNAALASNLS